MNKCDKCGLDMDLVGRRHRCVPKVDVVPETFKTEGIESGGEKSFVGVNGGVKERVYGWRKKHSQEYRSYMRDYMRKYRSRGNLG